MMMIILMMMNDDRWMIVMMMDRWMDNKYASDYSTAGSEHCNVTC